MGGRGQQGDARGCAQGAFGGSLGCIEENILWRCLMERLVPERGNQGVAIAAVTATVPGSFE